MKYIFWHEMQAAQNHPGLEDAIERAENDGTITTILDRKGVAIAAIVPPGYVEYVEHGRDT
jgi:hypothetical protein